MSRKPNHHSKPSRKSNRHSKGPVVPKAAPSQTGRQVPIIDDYHVRFEVPKAAPSQTGRQGGDPRLQRLRTSYNGRWSWTCCVYYSS